MDKTTVFMVSQRARWRDDSGGLILLDFDKGKLFSLNVQAQQVWLAAVRGCTFEEATWDHGTRFDRPSSESADAVRCCLGSFIEMDLLQIAK
jgi:hypothetical protein